MTTWWRPDLERIRAEIAAEAELELEVKVEASDGDGAKQGTKRKESPSNKGAVRARGEAPLEVQGVQRLSARSSASQCKECGGASICEHGRRAL